MKRSAITGLGAAFIAMLGASSAAQAALINFTVTAIGGTPLYTGPTPEDSTAVDVDSSILLVTEVDPDDASGLTVFDTVDLDPTNIVYGDGTGPTLPSAPLLTKSWTGDNGDMFIETLTTVDSINRATPGQIIVHLSGTVSDSQGLFLDTPAFFVLNATQFGGAGTVTSVSFTNTANTGAIPEASTWVMMALGFGALGYAGLRRRKSSLLSA